MPINLGLRPVPRFDSSLLPWLQDLVDKLNRAFNSVAGETVEDWSTNSTSSTAGVNQGGAINSTITAGDFQVAGGFCTAEIIITINGAGVANNPIRCAPPQTIFRASNQPIGFGYLYDASLNQRFPFEAIATGANQISFIDVATPGLAVLIGQNLSTYTVAVANGDLLLMQLNYRCVV